jgi:signal transduction histidine kinase/ActR/RegA family two-component response regulator
MISVLYVDDDSTLSDAIKASLEKRGEFCVDTTASPTIDFGKLRQGAYDILVSGTSPASTADNSLINEVRAISSRIPIILFAHNQDPESVLAALNGGADYYLLKGVDPLGQIDELGNRIVEVIKKVEDAACINSPHLLSTLLGNLEGFIYRSNNVRDLTLEYSSDGCLGLTGYPASDLIEKKMSLNDLIEPEHVERVRDQRIQALKNNEKFELEYPIRTARDDTVWVLEKGSGTSGSDEGTGSVEGLITNITTRKHAEDAFQQMSKKISILSSATRHDINNKLTILSGYTQLILADTQDPKIIKYVNIEEKAIDDITTILKFTKEYEKVGIDVAQWQNLTDVVARGVSQVDLGSIKFLNETRGYSVSADPLLERVFFNLADNAVRFGEKVTEIHAWCEQRDGNLVVLFEDNGKGITTPHKERIFDRGFGKNTGLGLFIAKEILAVTGFVIRETGDYEKNARFEILVPKGKFKVLPTV